MKGAYVELGAEVIEMSEARETKATAKNPRYFTLFTVEEIGQPGHFGHFTEQRAIHVIPLGFPPEPENLEVKTAKKATARSRVKVGAYVAANGAKECCLVLKARRSGNPPEKMCGANQWTELTVSNLWKGALDPFCAIEAWRKITRTLARKRCGYIVG
ncbi:MAG TPA: hypothetical protein P5080_02220 [Candidatus Paceibacterota bacterium]|nr:hypothetical protein [Candidatus Pacearchaeota archaeon]HRZ50785.1 hypothetical protein [Candidatus Paceibacterota bacterium]HSA36506.1 hypothetical protein [Candidatus Paceibacterota bacterium]